MIAAAVLKDAVFTVDSMMAPWCNGPLQEDSPAIQLRSASACPDGRAKNV